MSEWTHRPDSKSTIKLKATPAGLILFMAHGGDSGQVVAARLSRATTEDMIRAIRDGLCTIGGEEEQP